MMMVKMVLSVLRRFSLLDTVMGWIVRASSVLRASRSVVLRFCLGMGCFPELPMLLGL